MSIYDFSNDKSTRLTILRECDKQGILLKTQKAYILATVGHETGYTWQPVKEAYWFSEEWRRRNLRYYPWYGRGFVQITWQTNYLKYSKILNLDLIKNPDLALDPQTACFILVHGFKHGVFTGARISSYLNDKKTDFVNARRCINGTDKAYEIAGKAKGWLAHV